MNFTHFSLDPKLLQALERLDFTTPTPIQKKAIPAILNNKDVIAKAQTGSGKSAAFILPLLQKVLDKNLEKGKRPLLHLILVPTRELAIQVGKNIEELSAFMELDYEMVYGGTNIEVQKKSVHKGVHIVIATPGRLLDLVSQKKIFLSKIETLVLDEADRMLDMGFLPDIQRIIKQLPTTRQALLFSATYTKGVRTLAHEIMHRPVNIDIEATTTPQAQIAQSAILVSKEEKTALLSFLVGSRDMRQVLVFVNTKVIAETLGKELKLNGLKCDTLHGDKTQHARTKALEAFKEGSIRMLIATDIAARGIDIEALPVVINYELSPHTVDYIHRIGRTGRANLNGKVFSLVSEEELPTLRRVERDIQLQLTKEIVEGFDAGFSAEVRPKPKAKVVKKPDSGVKKSSVGSKRASGTKKETSTKKSLKKCR